MIIIKCLKCNKRFKSRTNSRTFCSRKCANSYNGFKYFKGRKIHWNAKISKAIQGMYDKGKIFGWKSVDIPNRKVLKREESYLWKGGISYSYGFNWRGQRLLVLKRDKHTCQICAKSKKKLKRSPDIHHIIPFELFVSRYTSIAEASVYANQVSNLITLCHSCHTTITNKILKIYKHWTIPREGLNKTIQEPVETIRWTPELGEDIVRTTRRLVEIPRNVVSLLD